MHPGRNRMSPQADAVQPPCGSDYSLQKDGTRREDGKAVKGAVDDFARRKGRPPPVQRAAWLVQVPPSATQTAWDARLRIRAGLRVPNRFQKSASAVQTPVIARGAAVSVCQCLILRLSSPRRQLQIAHRDNQRAFMWEAWLMRR